MLSSHHKQVIAAGVFSLRIFSRIDYISSRRHRRMICFIHLSLSLSEIYLEPAIRSRPGIGAPYRTPRTMARSLTMASLAMASGSALYSFACECTGVSCTGCPRNRASPRLFLSKLESKIFFSKRFGQAHMLFFLTFRDDCFKAIGF